MEGKVKEKGNDLYKIFRNRKDRNCSKCGKPIKKAGYILKWKGLPKEDAYTHVNCMK